MNLLNFKRPQRYIGNEWNVVKKDHTNKIKICISYPDIYEVGMSNLGLRIIYGMFNEFTNVVCERVFLPGEDYIKYLINNNSKLVSLETKTPIDEFEVIGFNLNYELNFINFLYILHLGKIPLYAKDRKNLVMVGGIANPLPLNNFVDVFFLGEFEEKIYEFVNVLSKYKDKEERLKALSEIDGFFVPKFYSIYIKNNKYNFEKIYPYAKLPVKRVFVKNLDQVYYPLKWLTPHTKIVHDRASVEIARGCPNGCSFCQARSIYKPYREKKISTICDQIQKIYNYSGYESFSLLALSASDYSRIEKLIDEVLYLFKENKIGLSLPSLRIDDVIGFLYKKLIPHKKTSLTVALEVANDNLRNKLNKKIDIKKLFEAAKILNSLKIQHLKIYFMFGFKEETEEDLIAIGDFLEKLNKEAKIRINTSINAFIPKPFSMWQNIPMQEESILENKQKIILKYINNKKIKVSISSIEKSALEAFLSRGDDKLDKFLYKIFIRSLKEENYNFYFNWKDIAAEENLDYRFYIYQPQDNFPWSFIN